MTDRERIAKGECVSPLTTERCPVCIDRCEAFQNFVPDTQNEKPQPITWQQLKEFVNSLPEDELGKTAHIIVEDDNFAKPLLEPFTIDKDIYVNKYEDEDSGSLEELKEMRGEDFDMEDYELLTAAGTPFLWAE